MSQHQQIVLVLLNALPFPPIGVKGLARHPGAMGCQEVSGGTGKTAGKVHNGTEDVEGEVAHASDGPVGHAVTLLSGPVCDLFADHDSLGQIFHKPGVQRFVSPNKS
jgi:hypothetical protein